MKQSIVDAPPGTRRFEAVGKDLLASLVVFLVAVPLSLGIALASGAPIISGLIAAVVGGVVVGFAGGAPLLVSGPAAGLTVMTYGFIHQFGWQATCAITIVAGVFQILLGFLRTGRITLAISPAVVHGMLAGIGVLIVLAQIHVVLGGTPESSALKNLSELPGQVANLHGQATLLGLLTIGILVLWNFLPKKAQVVPGALVAITVATVVSIVFSMQVPRVDLPGALLSFTPPQWPQNIGGFLLAAFSMTLVASTESLLSAVATDKMHLGKRAHLDRELIGQGLGNIVSGGLGGLPITGVIVRSAANVTAGAQTRLSTILHGIWVLLFVALLGSMLEKIPLAALAGLLVVVGARLLNFHHIRELLNHREAMIYFATLIGVVFISLLAGVGLGIGIAVILLLRRLAHNEIKVEARDGYWHVKIEGAMTFVSVPKLTNALLQIPPGVRVDVDLLVEFMDHAAFDALHGWRQMHERMGGHVDIDEIHENWYEQRQAMSHVANPLPLKTAEAGADAI